MTIRRAWLVALAAAAAESALVLAAGSNAQAGGIFGLLNGPGSVGALPGVEVRLCNPAVSQECFSAITASDGSFYFEDIPPGSYEMQTVGSSGETLSREIIVPSDDDLNLTVIAE